MIINKASDRFYQKQMENKNKVKKPVDSEFEDKLKENYESKYTVDTENISNMAEQYLTYSDISKISRRYGIENISTAVVSKAVSECEVRNVSLKECDYVKSCTPDGYLLKAVISEDNNTVYIEQKFEDGTVKAYEVDMSKIDENTENIMENAALEAIKEQSKDDSEDTDALWQQALEEFSLFVKDRIKNGPPKIATGASELSIEEWDKLIENIDGVIEDVKLEQQERLEKLEKQELEKELVEESKKTPFDKFNGNTRLPYYEYADETGVINYNGVTFTYDEHGALCLGDTSDTSKVIRIALAGGGTLLVNRDNKSDLAKAIGMFSPEDVKRIMFALMQDNMVTEAEYEIEETTNSVSEIN